MSIYHASIATSFCNKLSRVPAKMAPLLQALKTRYKETLTDGTILYEGSVDQEWTIAAQVDTFVSVTWQAGISRKLIFLGFLQDTTRW
jgi:hypothetical protein